MSHEGGPEPTQRTVAELLAKYGQETGERAPRRRRRRADDVEDTGAQAIIERVTSESGEMPVIRDDTPPPERTSHRHRTDFQRPVDPPPRRRQSTPPPSVSGPPTVASPGPLVAPPSSPGMPPAARPPEPGRTTRGDYPAPPANPPTGRRPVPPQDPGPRRQQPSQPLPKPPQQSQPLPKPPQPSQPLPKPQQHPSQQLRKPPPVNPQPHQPGQRSGVQPSLRARLDGDNIPPPPSRPPPEPMTEELPRVATYPSMEPVDVPRRDGPDSRTQLTPAVYPPRDPFPAEPEEGYRGAGYPDRDFDPEDDYDGDFNGDYDADYNRDYEREYGDKLRAGDGDRAFDDLDDDLDRDRDRDLDGDLDDLDEDRSSRSPAREWLIMAGQLALGVLGGAAVWLGFNWLWGALPQAALVVALAVIAGMVFIVRKIRRAEDLQTTVYAVLVGLLATVSPAALLLLNR